MSGIEFAKTKFAPEENLPERWRDIPQLSIEERDRRWWAIREKMAINDIDALILWHPFAVEYITHVPEPKNTPAIFPLEGEPIVSNREGRPFSKEWNYGVGQNWVKKVGPRLNIPKIIKELGLERGKLGDVGRARKRFHRGIAGHGIRECRGFGYHKIVEALPEAEFVDATSLVEEVAICASPEEIKFYEKAADIGYLCFEACKNTAKVGVKECEVAAAIIHASVAAGGRLAVPMIHSGPIPLMHGVGGVWGNTRKLQKGDIIIYELHINYGPCRLGTEHTFSLGEPREEFEEIADVCIECFKKGHDSINVGATLSEVLRAFRSPCEEAGMAYVELGFHNSPFHFPVSMYPVEMWTDWVDLPLPYKVRSGMMMIHNIDVYNPNWKESCLMFGDTTLATDKGPRKMTKVPVELTII